MNFKVSTVTNAIGTPGSPASLAVSTTATASVTVHTNNVQDNNLGGGIGGAVIIGASVPTSNPTVQFSYSLDGTNFIPDDGPFVVPTATGTYPYRYSLADAPTEAVALQVSVTNGTGNAITHWWQTVTLSMP